MKTPTGRRPTARELQTIKGLLNRAGSERNLQRRVRLAGTQRRRGRPPNSSRYAAADDDALLMAQLLRLGTGMSLHKLIKLVASWGPLSWKPGSRGASEEAMVKRLLAKAHAERAVELTPEEIKTTREWFIKWVANLDVNDKGAVLMARILSKHLVPPESYSV
jgi:hypothetical protein